MHVRKCHKETQYFYVNLIFNAKIKKTRYIVYMFEVLKDSFLNVYLIRLS